jgi:hypothetical protein
MCKTPSPRLLLSLIGSLVLLPPASGQDAKPAAENAAQTPEGWFEDLEALVRCLKEKHPKPFFAITEERFDAAVAELRPRIPSLKDHAILVEFMRLAAMLGDGHTAVLPGGDRLSFGQYPIGLLWLSDCVFIAAATEDHKDLLGARIVSVMCRLKKPHGR